MVDQEGAGGHLLHVQHGADLARDLRLDVVALVEHERDVGVVQPAAADDLDDDAEQLERVGGAHDEVVVGVEARVEVERAELSEAQQLHDDELDVRAGRVVAGVEADHRAVAERGHLGVGGAPVGNIGVVERRLEELVLEHQALLAGQAVVDLAERVVEAVLAGAHVGLAGVVRALGEPDLQVARAGGVHHVDALEVVIDRLAADAVVLVGEGAELVVLVLERVRVDRAERTPRSSAWRRSTP